MERWWGVCDDKRRTDGGGRQGELLFCRYSKKKDTISNKFVLKNEI